MTATLRCILSLEASLDLFPFLITEAWVLGGTRVHVGVVKPAAVVSFVWPFVHFVDFDARARNPPFLLINSKILVPRIWTTVARFVHLCTAEARNRPGQENEK